VTRRKPGCKAPLLGARLTARVGTGGVVPRRLAEHLAGCAARQLKRLEHASLDGRAVELSPELRARLRALVQY
jgi:hypothetical protein